MGFCYPGVDANGGAKPPRPECAPRWHAPLRASLPKVELTPLVGMYAQRHYLGRRRQPRLTETVPHCRDHGPDLLPLPPPRRPTTGWLKNHPWSEAQLLPALERPRQG